MGEKRFEVLESGARRGKDARLAKRRVSGRARGCAPKAAAAATQSASRSLLHIVYGTWCSGRLRTSVRSSARAQPGQQVKERHHTILAGPTRDHFATPAAALAETEALEFADAAHLEKGDT